MLPNKGLHTQSKHLDWWLVHSLASSKQDTILGRFTLILNVQNCYQHFSIPITVTNSSFLGQPFIHWGNLGELLKFWIWPFSHLSVLFWTLYVDCNDNLAILVGTQEIIVIWPFKDALEVNEQGSQESSSTWSSVWKTLLWWSLYQRNIMGETISVSYSLSERVKPLRECP